MRTRPHHPLRGYPLVLLLILTGTLSAAPRKRASPQLGAFTATVKIEGTVSGQAFTWVGPATFTPAGSENRRSLSGTGLFTIGGITPPPPPPPPVNPTVTGYQPNPATALQTVTVSGSGFDATAKASWQGLNLATTFVSATGLRFVAPQVTQASTGPVTVTLGSGASATGPSLTVNPNLGPPPPPPPPPGTISVRDFGARGDDVTDDTAACQHAISAAKAGSTIYFPAGRYRLSDQLKMNHAPACTLMGEGAASVLHSVGGQGIYVGTGGEPGGPVTIKDLKFQGNAGATMHSTILPTGGIQIFGPQNTVVDNCDFESVTSAVYEADPSKGTIVRNCRINGWARICFFLGGGDQILNCTATQTDPNLNGQQTSHGLYCHASNVLVQDCTFSNCRKYGAQIYSEEVGRSIDNVRLIHDTFVNCHDGGITLDHSQMGAGDAHNITIQDCQIRGTYGGSGLMVKNADGLTVQGCTIDGSPSYGLAIGVFAPYNVGFKVQNVLVTGTTITHCAVGLETYPSNGGTLDNILVTGCQITGNSTNIHQEGSTAGIKIVQ